MSEGVKKYSLHDLGHAIWHVEFMVGYCHDSPSRLDEENTADQWAEMVSEDTDMLRVEFDKMRAALTALPLDALSQIAQAYHDAECEALQAGRLRHKQRAEQLRLLRLAGDDTPEEDVPFGPFSKGGAA